MDPIGTIGGIIGTFVGFLGGFLNTGFFWPTLIAIIIAIVFNPKGPTSLDKLVVSLIAGTIGAFLLVKLFRGTDIDALLLAFLVLSIGLVWLFTATGLVGKIVTAILTIVSVSVLVGLSVTAPPNTAVATVVIAFRDAGTSIINAVNAFSGL